MRKFCDLNWALQQIKSYHINYNQYMTKIQFIDLVNTTYLCGRVAKAEELIGLLIQLKLICMDVKQTMYITCEGERFLFHGTLGSYELQSDQIQLIAYSYIIYMHTLLNEMIRLFVESEGKYICYKKNIHLKYRTVIAELCYLQVLEDERDKYVLLRKYLWVYALPKKILDEQRLESRLESQKQVGAKGEIIALEFEKNRLWELGYKHQSELVRKISHELVNIGYDIMSFNSDGIVYDRFIEVKVMDVTGKFYWSKNEMYVASILKESYYLYLVSEIDSNRNILIVRDPINNHSEVRIEIRPVQFEVHCYY